MVKIFQSTNKDLLEEMANRFIKKNDYVITTLSVTSTPHPEFTMYTLVINYEEKKGRFSDYANSDWV